MHVLAVETSTEYCSAALATGEVVQSVNRHAGQTHSQILLPLVHELLTEAGIVTQDLHAIVFGAGPGSFTGVRIACGVAQGLALAANAKMLGIGTLAAVAAGLGMDAKTLQQVIVCLDARMGEVYHAAYAGYGTAWQEVCAPGLYRPEAIPVPENSHWIGAGSGFMAYGTALSRRLGARLDSIHAEIQPDAGIMLKLALPRLAAGEGIDPADAAPLYVRNKIALTTSERNAGMKS